MDNIKGKISVLMGVYNCEKTITEAVLSIVDQTYSNWELIICDDGSTDNTYNIIKDLAKTESRIVLLKNEKNCGLNYTLNRCLKAATGEFIARMDGDDISVPERFGKQIRFLTKQTKYDIVSSSMIIFDETGEWGKSRKRGCPTPEDVVTGNPICHAPVMMRKKCIDEVGGYTEDRRMLRVEDVDLWIKLYAAGYRCFNLQEALYKMRNDRDAFNRRKYKYRINSVYVRLNGCKMLKLSPINYLKSFAPMIKGLFPACIRRFIRKNISRKYR